jgi:hypothetical protein
MVVHGIGGASVPSPARAFRRHHRLSGAERNNDKRQTARQQPMEMRIMYPFHPRCGETVLVQRRFAYRGIDLVVIPQPDGSIACISEWMTNEQAARFKLSIEPS